MCAYCQNNDYGAHTSMFKGLKMVCSDSHVGKYRIHFHFHLTILVKKRHFVEMWKTFLPNEALFLLSFDKNAFNIKNISGNRHPIYFCFNDRLQACGQIRK